MKDTRTPEQRAAIRELNEQLIHLEGWGGPLKTKDDVNEYLDNARANLSEVRQFQDSYRNEFLVVFTYLALNKLHLEAGGIKLMDKMNNVTLGFYRYAERSWRKEVAIIEAWVKQYKMLFK